jgi:uncharacterized protein YkwD
MTTRRVLALLALTATLLVMAQPALAGTSARSLRWRVLGLVNHARAAHDLPRLRLNDALSDDAWRHSVRMSRDGRLFHTSNMSRLLSGFRVRIWGENVGMGPTVGAVHRAFMRSSAHRSNILGRSFRRIGIGVARSGGSVWITQVFYG